LLHLHQLRAPRARLGVWLLVVAAVAVALAATVRPALATPLAAQPDDLGAILASSGEALDAGGDACAAEAQDALAVAFVADDVKTFSCAPFKVDGGKLVEKPSGDKVEAAVEKNVTLVDRNGKKTTGDALVVTFSDRKDLSNCKVFHTGDASTSVSLVANSNKVYIMPPDAKDLQVFLKCEEKK
jgi:hypothetical protein